MSIWDDFKAKYTQPRIENVTVGFSGIDPGGNNSSLTDEQINDLILTYLSKLTIKIDSGNLDPNAQEPEVPYIPLKPSEIPHERLDELLGGNNDGHYHLTENELDKLDKLIRALIQNEQVVLPSGGSDNHEQLNSLLGGSATGHYHLTYEELDKLGKLIKALIPAEQVVLPSGGTEDHEALQNILGGDTDGHYHFTEDEWTRLRTLLSTTFPSGSITPSFPTGPAAPTADDDPDGDGDLSADAGLPPNAPPEWGTADLPKNHQLYEGAGNMYYGTIVDSGKPYFRTALVVPMINNGSKTTINVNSTVALANDWDNVANSVTIKSYGKTLAHCFYSDWNESPLDSNGYKRFYYLPYPSTQKNVNRKGTGGVGHQSLKDAKSLVAGCVSADKNVTVFISDTGDVSRLTRTVHVAKSGKKKGQPSSITLVQDKTVHSCKVKANMGCVVWIPAYNCFCVSGKDGVAISGTGETWTKKAGDGTNAPIDLRGLTFRQDIEYIDNVGQKYTGCAFGWSADDKTFWKSYDGLHWMRHNIKPIPLKEVKSVAFSPETGIYCAAGTPKSSEGGLFVYFSKNLAAWTKVKVSIDDLTAESVIWMASTGKFVLMPSSGSYLYTFKAADWK